VSDIRVWWGLIGLPDYCVKISCEVQQLIAIRLRCRVFCNTAIISRRRKCISAGQTSLQRWQAWRFIEERKDFDSKKTASSLNGYESVWKRRHFVANNELLSEPPSFSKQTILLSSTKLFILVGI